MEIIYLTPLPEIAQFIIGQFASSCLEPSWWQLSIIIGIVAASGVVVTTTGVGLVGIVTTLVTLIMAGASLDTMAAALGTPLSLVGHSVEILTGLIIAIRSVLGC